MNTEPTMVERSQSGGPSQDVAEQPPWFDRVFTGDGEPPRLPEEPDRRRWGWSGDAQGALYFLLGLCCGLVTAYLIYHLGGRW
jgi:hypothetical protein